jgi:N-acetylglucosaminyl-diphospho-decaprenol L-rhamnosyltransferase
MLETDNKLSLPKLDNGAQVPDMSIVLVCWNNKDFLDDCLRSLYEGNLKCSYDVLVVDNGSTDGSQKMLAEKYPQVQLIQNENNIGLAAACNQGTLATTGRYVLLLNNDTIVNGPALDVLVAFLDAHPEAAAAAGRLLNPDGSFQSGYAAFSTLWEEFLLVTRIGRNIWPAFPRHGESKEPKAAGWLSSACLLLRRSALDQVGLLDESYFIYGDETDLQYRLNKAGWKVYFVPDSTIIHIGGGSMNRWGRRHRVYRGKLLFYKKHYGFLNNFLLRTMFFVMTFFKLPFCLAFMLLPSTREEAKQAWKSNLQIMSLCLNVK